MRSFPMSPLLTTAKGEIRELLGQHGMNVASLENNPNRLGLLLLLCPLFLVMWIFFIQFNPIQCLPQMWRCLFALFSAPER